jgi:hypothetical protein
MGTLSNVMVATLAYTDLFGKFRPYISSQPIAKQTNIPCNVFAINIADSGQGKDMSFDLSLSVLKPAMKLIIDKQSMNAEKKAKNIAIAKNKKAQEKEGVKPDKIVSDDSGWNQFYRAPSRGFIKMTTKEGLLKEAKQITQDELGNLFIKISELGNSFKTEKDFNKTIQILAEMYDTGNVPEDLVKTEKLKVGDIEGLGLSLLAHTSPTPLMKDQKVVEQLKNVFGSYFARRADVIVVDNVESMSNINLYSNIEEQVENWLKSSNVTKKNINDIELESMKSVQRVIDGVDLNKIQLTDDATKMYGLYFYLNKYYRRLAYMQNEEFMVEGLLTELTNRHWRTLKRAGIWTLAQNKSEVDKETMAASIYFTEFIGKGLRKLMEMVDLKVHERFIKAINDKEIQSTLRFDSLIKKGFVTKADKNQIDSLLVAVNSALQGKIVVRANYKTASLSIERIKEAKSGYGTSYIKFDPSMSKEDRKNKAYKGFIYKNTGLIDLVELLNIDCAYSPFEFERGYRNDDNVKSTTNYIVLDVDKSDLEMEILHETYLSGTLHIIATTSDPTNKKKFRVLIPIQQELGSNNAVYKYVIQRVADELMLDIDSLGRAQCMYAYSGSTVLNNLDSDIKPMDISNFLRDSSTDVQASRYDVKLTKAQQTKAQDAMLHDFDETFKSAIYAADGQGSFKLWRAGKQMQQAGCDERSIKLLMNKINSKWSSPMPQARLQSIILQTL